MFECKFDTDGDGDCQRCVTHGRCLEKPVEVKIVEVVLRDLWGRAGFDEFWGEIQADIKIEIREELANKVKAVLDEYSAS